MGNVISNDPPIPKRAATTHHTVFNMRHAVILSDTVDARLVRLFLVQARDPSFEGHWSAHIQKTALRLIKLRLMDEMYRTVAPLYPYIRTRTCACGSRPGSKFRVL
jgi:hypothetical protein